MSEYTLGILDCFGRKEPGAVPYCKQLLSHLKFSFRFLFALFSATLITPKKLCFKDLLKALVLSSCSAEDKCVVSVGPTVTRLVGSERTAETWNTGNLWDLQWIPHLVPKV